MMTAKRRSRKIQKSLRRNNDVRPYPLHPRLTDEERSRANHPAGKNLNTVVKDGRIQFLSLVPAEEAGPGAGHIEVNDSGGDLATSEHPDGSAGSGIYDVARLHPVELTVEEAGILEGRERFRQAILHVPRRGGKNSVIDKLAVNAEYQAGLVEEGNRIHREAEETLQEESAFDTAAAHRARGTQGAQGQPSAEPEGRKASEEERYYDTLDIEAILHGGNSLKGVQVDLPSAEEIDRLFEPKEGTSEDAHADAVEPLAEWERELLYGHLVEEQRSAEGEAGVPQEDPELDSLEHGKSHLVHFEREVNTLPVHVGSEPCSCELNKDHWVELGEN